MSTVATREELAQLGFTGFELGDSVELAWPSSEASQALGRGEITVWTFTAMLAAKFVGVPFASVGIPSFGGLQVAIAQTQSRVVKVTARPGEQLHLHGLRGSLQEGVTVYTPPEEPGTTYIDAQRLPALVARTESGGLALSATEGGLECAELVKPIQLAPLARLDPPVTDWMRTCRDSWLVDQATTKTQSHNSWSRVVAAGMLARLAMPSNAEDARTWMKEFTNGKVDENLAAPRRWVKTLNRQEIRSIEELALAEVDTLHGEIETFASDVDNNVSHWKHGWQELCHRRDDLECVLVLLDESGAVGRLREVLADLDREGEIVRLSVPIASDLGDERARRAALKNPGAWWSRPSDAS